ncbi:hypothetical protein F511_09548 [Dorcoceras hygrometricum]|uniref:Purple acid phosphatase n=1 Tax=Dorcoceras hygrometricum TaxID=472368 RepID=A0A2Z7CPD6_9LAMI|nr:hypothetical protein F511_09548 [Dorcoceras hygrometricum]
MSRECFVALFFATAVYFYGGFISAAYVRPPQRETLYRTLLDQLQENDGTSPQQVHISLSGQNNMRISWITSKTTPAVVYYGTSPGSNTLSANGSTYSYRYLIYQSGQIHNVVIGPLTPDTVYYYRCGTNSPEFNFKTPPSEFPIKFAIIGDLGQTGWTNSTLQHISKSNYDILILPGDLSYADFIQPLWDSFGRLVEPLASNRPWMVTQGNHEIEKIPILHSESFTSYNKRWVMPYEESGSSSNLYYSFEVTGVHVVMLGSYTDFDADSDQYRWLQSDLKKVDRRKTPWLIVVVHAPWYNSNEAHQGERESVEMKKTLEDMIYAARVDAVFAGHVHAYERFVRVYKDEADACGPVYKDPQPNISAFREASFGHGQLKILNATHGLWTWHRNDDLDISVASDQISLTSLSSIPACG